MKRGNGEGSVYRHGRGWEAVGYVEGAGRRAGDRRAAHRRCLPEIPAAHLRNASAGKWATHPHQDLRWWHARVVKWPTQCADPSAIGSS